MPDAKSGGCSCADSIVAVAVRILRALPAATVFGGETAGASSTRSGLPDASHMSAVGPCAGVSRLWLIRASLPGGIIRPHRHRLRSNWLRPAMSGDRHHSATLVQAASRHVLVSCFRQERVPARLAQAVRQHIGYADVCL